MVTEPIYNITNQCLGEIKKANIDYISKLRLESLFIRLKRQIITYSVDSQDTQTEIVAEDVLKLKELSQLLTSAVNKEQAIAELEKMIADIIAALEPTDQAGRKPD